MWRYHSALALIILTSGCGVSQPTLRVTAEVGTHTAVPVTTSPPPTPTLTPTRTPTITPTWIAPGLLTIPARFADAGNYALLAGAPHTITWEMPPPGALQYEFFLAIHDGDEAMLLGVDDDPADGVSTTWQVPEHLAAFVYAEAVMPDGTRIRANGGGLYSGDAPPVDTCTLSYGVTAFDVYGAPSGDSALVGHAMPGPFFPVIERTADGWYHIRITGNTFDYDTGQEIAEGHGWVYLAAWQGMQLFGPCDGAPLANTP